MILFALGAASLWAQTYGVAPVLDSALTDPTTGFPLSGGFVYVCGAGTTCPGTPQNAFTDSTGSTPLPNPIVLSSTGYSQCGSPGSSCVAFFNTALFYKLVIQNSSHVTLYTFDGLSASGGGGGGGGANYWALSGSTISNTNGGGAGNVSVGANFTANGSVIVNGSGGLLLQSQGGSNYASLAAAPLMASGVTWFLPVADSTGVQCLSSNGMGQLSFIACGGGGGGGGSPGGSQYSIQINNPSGSFYGDSIFTYKPTASPVPQVTLAGAFEATGTVGGTGFNAPSCTAFNCIQAALGGVLATQFTWQEEGAVPGGNAGFAVLAYVPDPAPHATNVNLKLGLGTSAYWPVAMTDVWNNMTNGDCVNITVASGVPYLTDAGGACTTGGGGGTVNAAVQFALPYYSATGTGTVLSGAANLSYTPSTNFLQLAGTTGGVDVPSVALTNAIQAPMGGVTARWIIATDSMFFIQEAPPALAGMGQARLYVDNTISPTTTGGAGLHINTQGIGTTYLNIATTTGTLTNGNCVKSNPYGNFIDSGSPCGGGGGGPVGADTQIPYNKAGVEFADANFVWQYTPQRLLITGTGSTSVAAVEVDSGYVTAALGFSTSSTATNAISASSGQITSKTMFVSDSYLWGTAATPALSSLSQARMYADSTSNTLRYSINGGAYQTLSTGGIASLNGLTGSALNIAGTTNEISVLASGTNITLSTPQAIGTASSPTFGGVTAGSFSSSGTGSTHTFQNGTGNSFYVDGNGNITVTGTVLAQDGFNVTTIGSYNSIQTTGGITACNGQGGVTCSAGAFTVGGSKIIDSGGEWVGGNISPVTGNILVPSGFTYAVAGGFFGQTHTVTIGGCSIFFEAGIAYAFSGC